jgi:hypothetical protein
LSQIDNLAPERRTITSTLTALIPYRQGLLPWVRAFIEHLAVEFPKAGVI